MTSRHAKPVQFGADAAKHRRSRVTLRASRNLIAFLLATPLTLAEAQRRTPVAARQARQAEPVVTVTSQRSAGTLGTSVDQILSALVAAGLAGYGSYLLADDLSTTTRLKGDWGYDPNANSAYAAVAFVTSTAVVMWAGRAQCPKGTLLGTFLGGAVVAGPLLAYAREGPMLLPIGALVLAPAQALASTAGYQLSRRASRAAAAGDSSAARCT